MAASDELLAMRETTVAAGISFFDRAVPYLGVHAYAHLANQTDGWVRRWAANPSRTHLEVVELIERAAVAAMRSEGRLL